MIRRNNSQLRLNDEIFLKRWKGVGCLGSDTMNHGQEDHCHDFKQ